MALAAQVHPCRLTSSDAPQLPAAARQRPDVAHAYRKQRSHPHDTCRPQYSRAVACSAAPQQQALPAPQTPYVVESDMDPQRLLGILNSTKNYAQLAAFVKSQQHVFLHSPLCVYAILHAVQLKDTISDDKIGKGKLTTEDKVLQQMETVENLLEQLCGAAVQFIPQLALTTQATLALALAQLAYYDEAMYNTIAESVLAELAEKVPEEAEMARGDAEIPRPSAALTALPQGLASGVLLSLIVAFSMNGHYDEELMNELADQVVALQDTFPDNCQLISIAAALLDLQHYHPLLLQTAAAAVLDESPRDLRSDQNPLGPDAVVSMLLALGFFRVQAPEFVEAAVQEFVTHCSDLPGLLDELQLSRLWKALLLISQSQGLQPPQELVKAYFELQHQQPSLMSLGRPKAAISLDELQDIQKVTNDVIQQQWEEAGLLAPVQILQEYEDMGFEIEQKVKVPVPGFLVTKFQQQQQQQERQQQQVEAEIDVCLKMTDGRRVAVLVLDETRYCDHPSNRLRGAAAVDIVVLKALGVSVLPLPVAEWQLLGGDVARRRKYLTARLTAALGDQAEQQQQQQ